jgi:hypothetical protein
MNEKKKADSGRCTCSILTIVGYRFQPLSRGRVCACPKIYGSHMVQFNIVTTKKKDEREREREKKNVRVERFQRMFYPKSTNAAARDFTIRTRGVILYVLHCNKGNNEKGEQ